MLKMKTTLALTGTFCTSLLAQPIENKTTANTQTNQLQAGYNASTDYLNHREWDVFVTTDYLYWDWQQDSLLLGQLTPTDIFQGTTQSVFQDPGYASGFQVGLGWNTPCEDHWNLYSEYTWYKNSDTRSVSSDSGRTFQGFQGPLPYLNGTYTSKIQMKFDALDLLLQRPFYFGKKLTANFSTGLTALWITQKLTANTNGLSSLWVIADALAPDSSIDNKSITIASSTRHKLTSWGLGPKFGLDTNWMLGYGLKIMGNLSASFLYTQYNLNQTTSGTVVVNALSRTPSSQAKELHNYAVIRPITTAFLGLGWDYCFDENRYQLALSAGYDFNVYWNYNMLDFVPNKITGNMYLQGLNVQAGLAF